MFPLILELSSVLSAPVYLMATALVCAGLACYACIDSHAHLGTPDYEDDRDQVVARAKEAGVSGILCPVEITDPSDLKASLRLAETFSHVLLAAGIHPHVAKRLTRNHLEELKSLARRSKISGIGEIGLDFHYNLSPVDEQEKALRIQLELAQDLGLPAIIHSRQGSGRIPGLLEDTGFSRGGILHCFTEDRAFAEKMMDRGFYISFSGIVTFPKAHDLREVARAVPLERILVETDSPYLTPVPFRGKIKRNEPAYVRCVIESLAHLKNTTPERVAEASTHNFLKLFPFEI